jgi:hypothetical protein
MSLNIRQRNYYDGTDFMPIFTALELQLEDQCGKNLAKAIRYVQQIFLAFNVISIRTYYKKWVNKGRPLTYVIDDQRKNNFKQRSLSNDGEHKIMRLWKNYFTLMK